MNNQKLHVLLAVAVVALVLSGCQSLPEPESSGDTLLVVDINRQTEEGGSIFGFLNLTIAPVADPSDTVDISLNAGESYETVQGLEPGTYRAVELKWEYQDAGKVIEYDPPSEVVVLEPGALSVYPYRFTYTVQDGRMSFRWDPMSAQQKAAFIESELAEEESFTAWRVTE